MPSVAPRPPRWPTPSCPWPKTRFDVLGLVALSGDDGRGLIAFLDARWAGAYTAELDHSGDAAHPDGTGDNTVPDSGGDRQDPRRPDPGSLVPPPELEQA